MVDDQRIYTVEFFLKNQFQNLPSEIQTKIVTKGKPTPHFLWKEKIGSQNRSFRNTWYQKKEWMTACPIRKRIFCFPCLLFDSKKKDVSHPWTVKGFDDLAHLSAAATKHERCQTHMENAVKLKLFVKKRLSPQSSSITEGSASSFDVHNEEVRRNRSILKRLIDACLYIAVSEVPIQRLDSRKLDDLRLLLCKYDMHFRESVNASGLLIQDIRTFREDVFAAIVKQIKAVIRSEVVKSDFFAISFNDITCWSTEAQVSVFLRYEFHGNVYERLFGFVNISNESVDTIISEICSLINDIGGEHKLVSQTYNDQVLGTDNSREIQRQILAAFSMAVPHHSFVQSLEDALLHACYSIGKVKNFFADFASIHAFFSKSSKFRELFLDDLVKTKSEYGIVVAQTKLELDFRNISTVFENYSLLKNYLTFIRVQNKEWDLTSIERAGSLLAKLNDFSFVYFLHVFDAILSSCRALFQTAQDTSVSQLRLQNLMQDTVRGLKQYRSKEKFLNFFSASCGLINGCSGGASDLFKNESPKDSPYEFTLYEIIDSLVDCIDMRFSDLNHMTYRSLLEKRHFNKFHQDFPHTILNSLKESVYGYLFDFVKLKSELSVVYASAEFHLDESNLLNFIYKASLSETLSEVTRLLKLFLTLPSTLIPPANFFSSVHRMDSRFQSAIIDESLTDILTITTERDLAFSVDHDEVINNIDETRYVKLKLSFK